MHAAEPGLPGEARGFASSGERSPSRNPAEESDELGTLRVSLRRRSAGFARAVCFGPPCQLTVFRVSSSRSHGLNAERAETRVCGFSQFGRRK